MMFTSCLSIHGPLLVAAPPSHTTVSKREKSKNGGQGAFSSGGCAFLCRKWHNRGSLSRASACISLTWSVSFAPLAIIEARKENVHLLQPLWLRQVRENGGWVWVSQSATSAVSGLHNFHNATYFCAQIRNLIRLHLSPEEPHDYTPGSGWWPQLPCLMPLQSFLGKYPNASWFSPKCV